MRRALYELAYETSLYLYLLRSPIDRETLISKAYQLFRTRSLWFFLVLSVLLSVTDSSCAFSSCPVRIAPRYGLFLRFFLLHCPYCSRLRTHPMLFPLVLSVCTRTHRENSGPVSQKRNSI